MTAMILHMRASLARSPGSAPCKLSDQVSAYAQAGYQFATEQTFYGIRRDGVQGNGLRYSW